MAAVTARKGLVFGRTIRGIVEGDSVPTVFLPRDFDQIEQAARDAEAGKVIKPVLRTGS